MLQLLAQLRAQHTLLIGALLSRALSWLRTVETELRRLQRRPLAATQLSAVRRQLAGLERQLPRGEQLLSTLRLAAGPAADSCCSGPELRLSELRSALGSWSAYVSHVTTGWRRQQETAAEAAAELLQLERQLAAGAAEEEAVRLTSLERRLDEADRQRAALRDALLTEDERAAAAAAALLRARLLLVRLQTAVVGQTEADRETERSLNKTR